MYSPRYKLATYGSKISVHPAVQNTVRATTDNRVLQSQHVQLLLQ
jgi:hypothetical protein